MENSPEQSQTTMQLTVPPQDESSTSTGFINENLKSIVEGDKVLPVNSIGDERNLSIAQLLSNYRLIEHRNYDGNTVAIVLDVANMMNQQQFATKVNGAMGIRGIFKFKITWNTTPMTRGLYIMAYLPQAYDAMIPDPANNIMPNFTFLTGSPHVLVNIARDTSAELIIPYIGETPYIPLYNSDRFAKQAGHLVIMPVIRAVDTAVATFTASIYFAMEDVELFGVQPIPAQAQSAFSSVLEAVKKQKVISKGTGAISEWFDSLKPSPLTQAAGWATGGISKVADFMGWSKPYDIKSMDTIISMPNRDLFQGDGTFSGVKFTMNSDSGIATKKMGPHDEDEMSIKHFTSRSEIFDSFTIDKTTTIGTELYTCPILPGDFYTEVHVGAGATRVKYIAVTHLNYLAKLFSYYRGSIKMKLIPVTTRFHSARLRVVIAMTPATNSQAYDNMAFTYSCVVDLDDPSTWEFTIPYLSQNPWRNINSHNENVPRVHIFLENKLVAPDVVSPAIDIMVAVRGGDDFEVCAPAMRDLENTNMFSPVPNAPNLLAIAESDPSFDLAPILGSSKDASELAIGDPVRSLRPLTRRFGLAMNIANAPTAVLTNQPIGPKPTTTTYFPDYVGAVTACYAFYRGGTRYYAQNDLGAYAFFDSAYNPTVATTNGIIPSSSFITQQLLPISQTDVTKFELPYYSPNYQTNWWKNSPVNGGYYMSAVSLFYRTTPTNNTFVTRSASDDYDCGYLIGAPWQYVLDPA